jgi:transcriptional regulator with XRE-family HTH domain
MFSLHIMLQWCKNVRVRARRGSGRQSSQKHNVARLRVKLNEFEKFNQEQFAKLIGCSVQKLRNIETGRTPLDELLARRIADETGVAREWLLENNTKAPPVSNTVQVGPNRRGRITLAAIRRATVKCGRGVPFTEEAYKVARRDAMQRDFGIPSPRERFAWDYEGVYAMIFYAWMRAIFLTKHADAALWKTQKFLEGLASEYGHNRDILPASRLEIASREHQVQWVKSGIQLAEKFAREWQRPPSVRQGCLPKPKSKQPSRKRRR